MWADICMTERTALGQTNFRSGFRPTPRHHNIEYVHRAYLERSSFDVVTGWHGKYTVT